MKKRLITSELGSMMIEALAMLALIAAITPILYRKTAERTTELQDINSAGEIRSIIKAVDDYVSANFDAISQGETVTTTCNGTNESFDYNALKDQTDAHVTVPLGHFCEFLPYGVLDSSGNAKASRLFSSNYQVVLKLKGDGEENGNRVVTSFVVTEPNMEMREMRSSSIASMIGGNGGYVTEGSTGTGEDASGGKISGNLGIWGIDDAKTELGVTVKKGAIVAASIQGISSQNAKIDVEGVLYRKAQPDRDLNTMSTTLYMGATGSAERNSIVNIRDLIVGGETEGANNTVYIDPTKIQVKSDLGGDTTLSPGFLNLSGVTLSGLLLDPELGRLLTISAPVDSLQVKDNLEVIEGNIWVTKGGIDIGDGTTGWLEVRDLLSVGTTGDTGFNIMSDKTTIQMPLTVTAENDCSEPSWENCALHVAGDANFAKDVHVGGDLTVDESFSAKNLHAQENLSVGKNNKALNITYDTGSEASTLDFGNGFITAEKKTGSQFLKIEGSDTHFTVNTLDNQIVAQANNLIRFGAVQAGNYSFMENVGNSVGIYGGYEPVVTVNNGYYFEVNTQGESINAVSQGSYLMRSPIIHAEAAQYVINLDEKNLNGEPLRSVFKVRPDSAEANIDKYFSVEGDTDTVGKVEVKDIPTYVSGASANLYMTNDSDIIVQNTATPPNNPKNIVRIGHDSDADNNQIDISSAGIFAKDSKDSDATKVLKIDLTPESEDSDGHSVYIRKGAIELTATNDDGDTAGINYVKADRFVANLPLEAGALLDYSGNSVAENSRYEVNPAYTSVMHDIKLTSRGGARLSDILPDFINKGIYIVDNTYPALGHECGSGTSKYTGIGLNEYRALDLSQIANVTACTTTDDLVSPWAGFVPTPTCPPGYSKVITVVPASFDIARAGTLTAADGDIVPNEFKPITGEEETSVTPMFHQKNTWLKSFAVTKGWREDFKGWDVGMGYIYPLYLYPSVFEHLSENNRDMTVDERNPELEVIWNLFPVYAGTLEGYATVYCYFNRNGVCVDWYPLDYSDPDKAGKCKAYSPWNEDIVDTQYDQLGNFRAVNSKSAGGGDNVGYIERLKGGNSNLNEW